MTQGRDGVWRPKVEPQQPQPTPADRRRTEDQRLRRIIGDLMREAVYEFPADGTEFARYQWADTVTRVVIEVFKRRRVNPPTKIIDRARRAVKRQIERELAERMMSVEVPNKLEVPGCSNGSKTGANTTDSNDKTNGSNS